MKQLKLLLVIFGMILLISACSNQASSGGAPKSPVTGDTVGTLCHDALLAFESDAANDPLDSMAYRNGQADSFDVADLDVIAPIYETLQNVPVGKAVDDPGILDADVVFSFTRKSGAEFTVRFVTRDYFGLYRTADAKFQYYQVPDASLVRDCQEAAMAADGRTDLPEKTVFGDMFPLDIEQDVCSDMDINGDGQNDKLFFDFIDNGDEAFGALNLSIATASGSFDTSFYPAERESVFACGVRDQNARTLLLIATDAKTGWPSGLCFLTVKNGKLMQYTLNGVSITGYENGVFTLSDLSEIAVSDMDFQAVKQ